MTKETGTTADARAYLEQLFESGLDCMRPRDVDSSVRDVYNYLRPLCDDEDAESKFHRMHFYAIRQLALDDLIKVFTPPDARQAEAYLRLAQEVMPALNAAVMGDLEAQFGRVFIDEIGRIKDAREVALSRARELEEPAPESHYGLKDLLEKRKAIDGEIANIDQAIDHRLNVMGVFVNDYMESHASLGNIAGSILDLYQRESEGHTPDEAIDSVLDFIEALYLPMDDTWLYPQKRDYLNRLYSRIRDGSSTEQLSRWASDVAFATRQEKLTEEDTYNLADGLMNASRELSPEKQEEVRELLRGSISRGCGLDEALNYVDVLGNLGPEERKRTRGIVDSLMGCHELTYETALKMAEDAMAKQGASQEEADRWIRQTLHAMRNGCDYETSQAYCGIVSAREAEGRTSVRGDEEDRWKETLTRALGLGIEGEIATTLADYCIEWRNLPYSLIADTIGGDSDLSYRIASELTWKVVDRGLKYNKPDWIEPSVVERLYGGKAVLPSPEAVQRIMALHKTAITYVSGGMSVDEAIEAADASFDGSTVIQAQTSEVAAAQETVEPVPPPHPHMAAALVAGILAVSTLGAAYRSCAYEKAMPAIGSSGTEVAHAYKQPRDPK